MPDIEDTSEQYTAAQEREAEIHADYEEQIRTLETRIGELEDAVRDRDAMIAAITQQLEAKHGPS